LRSVNLFLERRQIFKTDRKDPFLHLLRTLLENSLTFSALILDLFGEFLIQLGYIDILSFESVHGFFVFFLPLLDIFQKMFFLANRDFIIWLFQVHDSPLSFH
jgi:hypothetical protein